MSRKFLTPVQIAHVTDITPTSVNTDAALTIGTDDEWNLILDRDTLFVRRKSDGFVRGFNINDTLTVHRLTVDIDGTLVIPEGGMTIGTNADASSESFLHGNIYIEHGSNGGYTEVTSTVKVFSPSTVTYSPGARLFLGQNPAAALEAATKQYVDSAAGAGLTKPVADTYYVNVDGDTMTGLLVLSADPTAALGAATKQYVDNRQTVYDGRYVDVAGDTMTGPLVLPSLAFTPTDTLGRKILWYTGWEAGLQTNFLYHRSIGSGGGGFIWYRGGSHSDAAADPGAGGVEAMRLTATGLDVGRGLNQARPLSIYGLATGPATWMSFYDGAATPNHLGRVGYDASTTLFLRNEQTNAPLWLVTQGSGPIAFMTGGSEAARFAGTVLLVGKTASSSSTVGVEVQGGGSVFSTVNASGFANYVAVRGGSGDATGQAFASFRRASTGEVGSITQSGASAVLYNTTSDRRLKRLIGPVPDAVGRLRRLRVHHFAWKVDDTEQDGFVADEVATVVPDAVSGQPDAVDTEGEIVPQMLDQSRLVPLLTAALQEALDRIGILEHRIARLEAV